VLEKGTLAFLSFVRAYKEHQCSFIFRMDKLDIAQLAHLFSLLRLPTMPELRKTTVQFKPPCDVDPSTVPYADAEREKFRQAKLAREAEKPKPERKRKDRNDWSEKKAKQAKKTAKANKRLKDLLTNDEIDEITKVCGLRVICRIDRL